MRRATFDGGAPTVPDYRERSASEVYEFCRRRGYRLLGGSSVMDGSGEWVCNIAWTNGRGEPADPPTDVPADLRC